MFQSGWKCVDRTCFSTLSPSSFTADTQVLVMLVDLVIDFLSRQYAQLNDVQILQQLRFARTMSLGLVGGSWLTRLVATDSVCVG